MLEIKKKRAAETSDTIFDKDFLTLTRSQDNFTNDNKHVKYQISSKAFLMTSPKSLVFVFLIRLKSVKVYKHSSRD